MIDIRFRHDFAPTRSSEPQLDIAFSAPSPGATVLFGPSGAGKSSVVAALAGLLRPRSARIAVDDAVLSDTAAGLFLPPERRRLGLVFQDARLFPHLSVDGNLRYGMRRALPGPFAFDRVIDLLGIGALLRRRPHTLSGGERQRVAIGRALLSQPRLLLMDEPLASLDAGRRAEILAFVVALKESLPIPIVYVTHDAEEMAVLADTVVLLRTGRVIAAGPLPVLSARADLPLAERDDAGAVAPALVEGHESARGLTAVRLEGGPMVLVPLLPMATGTRVRLKVPARDIALAAARPPEISIQNVLPARIIAMHAPAPATVLVELDAGGPRMLARITADAASRLSLQAGVEVFALVKSSAIAVLGGRTG